MSKLHFLLHTFCLFIYFPTQTPHQSTIHTIFRHTKLTIHLQKHIYKNRQLYQKKKKNRPILRQYLVYVIFLLYLCAQFEILDFV